MLTGSTHLFYAQQKPPHFMPYTAHNSECAFTNKVIARLDL